MSEFRKRDPFEDVEEYEYFKLAHSKNEEISTLRARVKELEGVLRNIAGCTPRHTSVELLVDIANEGLLRHLPTAGVAK